MQLYFYGLWLMLSAVMIGTLYNTHLRMLLVHGKVRQGYPLIKGPLGFLFNIEVRRAIESRNM